MSEFKRNIKKIGLNSFLINNGNETFYYLSLESVEIIKVRVILIKMLKSETYVYEAMVQFNDFGTNDPSPQETFNNVSYLILTNNYAIKENNNRAMLFLNSKNKGSIELKLHNKNDDVNKDSIHKENINNMQNRITELLNTISMQDKKIYELKQKEENHKIIISKIEQLTNNINNQLDKEQQQQSKINNQMSGNNTISNPYSTNNNNPYDPYNNSTFSHKRTVSHVINNPYSINNINGNTNVQMTINTVYSPYLPENTNVNNLLTRTDIQGSMPVAKMEKKRVINLDSIQNYK